MPTWNIVLFVINILLFILIASKYTQFNNVYQENLRVQQGIESLVERNSQLVDVILDELEEKLNEAHTVLREIDQRTTNVVPFTPVGNTEHNGQMAPQLQSRLKSQVKTETQAQAQPLSQSLFYSKLSAMTSTEEKFDLDDNNISIGAKVVYMKKMGYSVQDIAQKLNVSQGEIALKLNLQSKQESPLRKSKGLLR